MRHICMDYRSQMFLPVPTPVCSYKAHGTNYLGAEAHSSDLLCTHMALVLSTGIIGTLIPT